MTLRVFFQRRHFRDGTRITLRNEARVVAESSLPAALFDDAAFPGALTDQRMRIRRAFDVHDDAAIARGTARRGQPFERPQQLVEILRVAGIVTRETSRMDARRAAKSIDFDAGVVCDRGQPCQARGIARLDQRVFEEGHPGLRWSRDLKVGLRGELETARTQQFRKLAQLARIRAREHYAPVQHVDLRRPPQAAVRTSVCSWKSFAIPLAARFSSASSSCRRKA